MTDKHPNWRNQCAPSLGNSTTTSAPTLPSTSAKSNQNPARYHALSNWKRALWKKRSDKAKSHLPALSLPTDKGQASSPSSATSISKTKPNPISTRSATSTSWKPPSHTGTTVCSRQHKYWRLCPISNKNSNSIIRWAADLKNCRAADGCNRSSSMTSLSRLTSTTSCRRSDGLQRTGSASGTRSWRRLARSADFN